MDGRTDPGNVVTTPLRICLIDDNESVRDVLAFGLREAGHDVTEAGDGASGLAAVRDCTPDVVVTDLTLPDMEGAEIVRALRAAFANVPIVAMSGGSGTPETYAEDLGADVYLAKPFRLKALAAAMAEAMALHGR